MTCHEGGGEGDRTCFLYLFVLSRVMHPRMPLKLVRQRHPWNLLDLLHRTSSFGQTLLHFSSIFLVLPVFWGGCGVQVVDCRCGMIGMWLRLWHVLVVTQCLLLLLVSSLQGTNAGECRAGGSWATCKHRHGHRSFLFGDGAGAAQDM